MVINNVAATNQITTIVCQGDLSEALSMVNNSVFQENSAYNYFILSSLTFILDSDIAKAVLYDKIAVELDGKMNNPLRNLDDNCGGLRNVFYSAGSIIKQLRDKADLNSSTVSSHVTAYSSMAVECYRAGLHNAAFHHMEHAVSYLECFHLNQCDEHVKLSFHPNFPDISSSSSSELLSLYLRDILLVPTVYEGGLHVVNTRCRQLLALQKLQRYLKQHPHIELRNIDEFSLTPHFYVIYQGYNDMQLLSQLQQAYYSVVPELSLIQPKIATRDLSRPVVIGFVSSHFRTQHSICKLFCGIITHLFENTKLGNNGNYVRIVLFSATQNGNEYEIKYSFEDNHLLLKEFFDFQLIKIGLAFTHNRNEVLDRNVDILVYLDIGLDPATRVWASSRLAPIQVRVYDL